VYDTAVKWAGAAANLALAAAEWAATSGALALGTALVAATGGVILLLGVIGGLAVGIIDNFDSIKSAASDTFGFLKDVMNIVVDVLLTYFVTSWNLMVDLFQAIVQGVSPLTDLFMDLASQLGLVGGKGEDGAGAMGMLAAAGDAVKGIISALATIFGALIDTLGFVLTIISTILRIALIPLTATISGLISLLGLLSDWWDFILEDILGVQGGVSGLIAIFIDLFDTFLEGMSAIPKVVENIANTIIGIIDGFLGTITDAIPGVDLGQIGDVSFTNDKLKSDRDDLAANTEPLMDSLAAKGDNTITYNEDNSTNIDQTVNADPEDQAQLSRVVTDAIAEANSFERRRQGGQ
jgi:phage-related protein